MLGKVPVTEPQYIDVKPGMVLRYHGRRYSQDKVYYITEDGYFLQLLMNGETCVRKSYYLASEWDFTSDWTILYGN